MRIVFFTDEHFHSRELFLYVFAHVGHHFPDVHIVALCPEEDRESTFTPLYLYITRRRFFTLLRWKRVRRFGIRDTLENVLSYPLRRIIHSRNYQQVQLGLRALPRPPVKPHPDAAIRVGTLNGPDAVAALRDLEPDVIIPISLGVLRKQIFEIPSVGTVNLHPGIAPLIRGVDQIYWALWARKPEWIGSTVHFIDEGIDTGPVLDYAPVGMRCQGERFPDLFVRTIEKGVESLVNTLLRLERGETWTINPPEGERVYRSIIPGWKLGIIEIRGALLQRRSRQQCHTGGH